MFRIIHIVRSMLQERCSALAGFSPGLNSKVSERPPVAAGRPRAARTGALSNTQYGQSATIITENINILKDKYVSIKLIHHSVVETDTTISGF